MPTGIYYRSPAIKRAMRRSLALGHKPASRRKALAKIRANGKTPQFREKMRVAALKSFADPKVKERHVAGVKKALAIKGPYFKGGNGQELTGAERQAERLLAARGFVRQHPVKTRGHGTTHNAPSCYKLDLANPKTKVGIELDGPSHRHWSSRAKEAKKEAVLTALGWRIVRVQHAASSSLTTRDLAKLFKLLG